MIIITPKKQKALQALLTHPTKKAAANAAGITTRTLLNYFADTEFKTEYNAAFQSLVTDATRQAQKALSPALSTLQSIVENEKESAGNRISAARSLLEYGLRLTEFNDILQMLETVESNK